MRVIIILAGIILAGCESVAPSHVDRARAKAQQESEQAEDGARNMRDEFNSIFPNS